MNYFWGESTPAAASTASPDAKVYKSESDVDFQAFGEENVQILLERDSGVDGVTSWELVDEQEGGAVKIWRGEVQGNSWSPFRASRMIAADMQTIQDALLDSALLLQLDDMTESIRVLKTVDAHGKLSLRHILTKGIFPVAAREFVIVTYATTLPEGGLVIASRSIALEGVPVLDGAVRGVNVVSGYLIKELAPANGKPRCEVTLLAHADLQGYIPATIVNMLGTSATVKILTNLQTLVEKQHSPAY
ncbi:hypothetical protein PybrP1_007748 [[Pythium] brassicae (nom. inval.)]|nr:hypothetical protein PybrP1_007748 [[Pythium] brassicae (nom. inval.)]